MLFNKPQQLSHVRSNTFSVSKYLIQFSYRSKPKSKKHKSMFSNHTEGQFTTRKRYSDQNQSQQTSSASKSQHYQSPPKKKERIGVFMTQGSEPAIMQGFPGRKVKTNEHQLFKILAKYQYHQNKKKRSQQMSQRKPLFCPQSPRRSNRTNHKLPSHLCSWVKERYCANRDKDNGEFPVTFFRNECSIIETPIKLKNPSRK